MISIACGRQVATPNVTTIRPLEKVRTHLLKTRIIVVSSTDAVTAALAALEEGRLFVQSAFVPVLLKQ